MQNPFQGKTELAYYEELTATINRQIEEAKIHREDTAAKDDKLIENK